MSQRNWNVGLPLKPLVFGYELLWKSLCVFPHRPVPGSLSSLLHLRNRQRQPLPASMPGTLPDPTMPGSSAVLMPVSTTTKNTRAFSGALRSWFSRLICDDSVSTRKPHICTCCQRLLKWWARFVLKHHPLHELTPADVLVIRPFRGSHTGKQRMITNRGKNCSYQDSNDTTCVPIVT